MERTSSKWKTCDGNLGASVYVFSFAVEEDTHFICKPSLCLNILNTSIWDKDQIAPNIITS